MVQKTSRKVYNGENECVAVKRAEGRMLQPLAFWAEKGDEVGDGRRRGQEWFGGRWESSGHQERQRRQLAGNRDINN